MGRLMRMLLDTPALLWALLEPHRLSTTARAAIVDRSNELMVSAASAWEVATKTRLGKLPGAEHVVLNYSGFVARLGAVPLAVTQEHALSAGSLVWSHRDPFDRMLAAQSIAESLPLVTADTVFAGLPGVRVVW